MNESLRDYGRPQPESDGTPTWEPTDAECPNCNAKVCKVTVDVVLPLLRGGKGVATYLGCPACPWASPAMCVTKGDTP